MKKIICSILFILMLTALLCGCTQSTDTDTQTTGSGTLTTGSGTQTCAHVNQEVVGAVTATCSAAGYTGDTKCLDCNTVIQTGTEIAVLEHKVVTEGAVPATCLTGGRTGVGICEICKVVVHEDAEVLPTGHTERVVNAIESTCTSGGYTGDVVCGVCNAEIRTGEVTEKGEHMTVVINSKDPASTPSCYLGDEVCEKCNLVITKDLVAHTVVVKNQKNATCTSTGYTGDEYCSTCNAKLKTGTTIAKREHSPTTINAKAATCTEDGYSGDVYCSYCKVSISTGSVIHARGEHDLCLFYSTPATYEKGGYSGDVRCLDCGVCIEVGHNTDPLPKLPEYECNTDGETLVFNQINEQRAIQGLPALQLDTFLHTAVYNRVREYIYCYVQGNVDVHPHARPDGYDFTAAVRELGINYSRIAEIIAGSSGVDGLVPAWMSSTQGHREQGILGEDWTHMSVCVVEYKNDYYSVVIFHNDDADFGPWYNWT